MLSLIIVDSIMTISPLLKQNMLNVHQIFVSLRVTIFDKRLFL